MTILLLIGQEKTALSIQKEKKKMQRFFSIPALILSLAHLSQAAYIESFANRGKYLVAKDSTTFLAQNIKTANVNADFSFDISTFSNKGSYVGCTNSSFPGQYSFGQVAVEIGRNGYGHIGIPMHLCAFIASQRGLIYASVDEMGHCFGSDSLPADILSRATQFGEVCGTGLDKRIVYKLAYSIIPSSLDLFENNIIAKLRLKQTGKVMNVGILVIKRADPNPFAMNVTNILLQSKADPTLFAMVENDQVFLREFENTASFKTKATFSVSSQFGSSKILVKMKQPPLKGSNEAWPTYFKPLRISVPTPPSTTRP